MVRRSAPAAVAAIVVLLSFVAPASHAQYMYLDSNGDGIHDGADSLTATGTTIADVWLVTNKTRGGGSVVCLEEPGAAFTVNSFEVILHAEGGSVYYGTFESLQPTMTANFGSGRDSTDLYAGFGGAISHPPGAYRLGRVTIDVVSGNPSVTIAPRTSFRDWYSTTFGSQCVGLDFDNTLKLGSDWFDTDGLRASGSPAGTVNGAPQFQAMDPVSIAEGEVAERAIIITDADSDSLSLTVLERPRYVTVGPSQLSTGRLEVPLWIAPGYFDAGAARLLVAASDGVGRSMFALFINVANANRVPVFDRIQDLEIDFGVVTNQPVTVRDPDIGNVTTRIQSGPPFANLISTPAYQGVYSSVVRLAPTQSDPGAWTVVLAASDGIATGIDSFHVTVLPTSPYRPPVLDSIPDFVVRQGSSTVYPVRAADPDMDPIEFVLGNSPWFVRLDGSWWEEPGTYGRMLSIWPYRVDPGEWHPTITASDGVLSSSRTFRVAVADSEFAPYFRGYNWWCAAQGEVRTYYSQAEDPDGDLASVTYGPTPSWGTATDLSSSRRQYTFAPTSDDPPQEFPIEIVAVDATGLETRETVTAAVTQPGGCNPGGVFASEPNNGPPAVPEAGGPYAGVAGAPIRFDGSGTINGTNRQHRWGFGDGAAGLGQAMDHRYEEGGTFKASLCIFDKYDSTTLCDTALVVVRDALAARAFLPPEDSPIVTRSARQAVMLRMERAGNEYALEDLAPASLCLWSPGHGEVDSIFAQGAKGAKIEDRDRNGVPDLAVAFAKEDLRRLFANVRGKRSLPARLQGRLPNGARVRASLELEILGAPAKGVAVWPNPMNPRGVIAFEAKRPGHAVVRLYDVNGRLVRTLLDGRVETGEVQVPIDGLDEHGRGLSSGVYFYQVTTVDGAWRGRATILK